MTSTMATTRPSVASVARVSMSISSRVPVPWKHVAMPQSSLREMIHLPVTPCDVNMRASTDPSAKTLVILMNSLGSDSCRPDLLTLV